MKSQIRNGEITNKAGQVSKIGISLEFGVWDLEFFFPL
jgi:hypothetical protein